MQVFGTIERLHVGMPHSKDRPEGWLGWHKDEQDSDAIRLIGCHAVKVHQSYV